MERLNIEYVSHGIGNNFGDTIELNENLKKYPELHEKVLQHELAHTDAFFSKHDLKLDLLNCGFDQWEMFKFMLRHPKSFTQFLPFYFSRKRGFVYDVNLCIIYLVTLLLVSLGVFLSFAVL